MTTFRTGNNWRVTIVEEGTGHLDEHGHHDDARLRAIVMDGKVLTTDPELAERVARLLTADSGTPDRTYLRGVSEALAEVRRRLDRQCPDLKDTTHRLLRDTAAELGLDEDAPGCPRISPESDLQGSVVGPDRIDVPGRSEGDMSGHRPERRGSDSEGYGACTGCGDLWPCAGYRGTA